MALAVGIASGMGRNHRLLNYSSSIAAEAPLTDNIRNRFCRTDSNIVIMDALVVSFPREANEGGTHWKCK